MKNARIAAVLTTSSVALPGAAFASGVLGFRRLDASRTSAAAGVRGGQR
jgi:hypothetical protein